jgi:hypothetical protein
MKKLLFAIPCLIILFSQDIMAQETKTDSIKKNEIVISTSFDNLSFRYARNISKDLFLKVGIIDLEKDSRDYIPTEGVPEGSSYPTTSSSKNGGILLGLEKQKQMERFLFSYGLNLHFIYNDTHRTTTDPNVPADQRDMNYYTYTPGLGIGLGCYYKLIPNLFLGFEVNPSINYDIMTGESTNGNYTTEDGNFYFTLSNNAALFALKFKF